MRNPDRQASDGEIRLPREPGFGEPEVGPEKPQFSAMLTPHRSLGPGGFLILIGAVGVVSFCAGMAFVLAGAWPVFGFFMLDVLLIYWAFRLNYRSGRLYETVHLAGDTLTITRVPPSGRSRSWAFNPYWARCEISEGPCDAADLSLASHGNRLVFGSFLTAAEKRDFAEALSGVLHACRSATNL